jgi:signal transduction histidine kinase
VAPVVVGEMDGIVQEILAEEPTFLARMEQIVARYEVEARDHLVALKHQEAIFVLTLLAVLSFLGAAVLLPAIRELRRRVEHREIEERLRLNRSLLEAAMREREMIGKDLHDGLGQVLAGIGMMVRTLALGLSARREPEADAARKIEHLVGDAIAQTRDLARALHPVEITDGGLEAALRTLAESASATLGVECTVDCEGTPPPTDDRAKTHLYRIAQEAVSNAVKHGQAGRIEIRMAGTRSSLLLTITDDGSGLPCMPPEVRGLGLGIMADRAHLLGGRLEVRPAATGGTTVAVCFDGVATLCERLAA